jgi:uncharacterized membrane protein
MKFIAFISAIVLLLFSLIIFYGLTLSDQTEIEEIIVIEAPLPVVWNSLLDFKEHSKWLKSIETLYNNKNSARQVRYNFGENTILVNQQVRIRESAKAIDFFQIGQEKFTELEGISGQIFLQHLADGNTEVHWKIMYSVKTLSQRVVAKFSAEPDIKNLIRENLSSFKKYNED